MLSFKNIFFKTNNQKPLYIFVSKSLVTSKNVFDPENWYVTDLVSEVR